MTFGIALPALGQTCDYVPTPKAEEVVALLPEGTVVQAWCAPCREKRARRIVVDEAEARVVDTIYSRVLINGAFVDPAYLYLFDPGRKRWRNLGLAVACHEEDDVPPTLPAARAAE